MKRYILLSLFLLLLLFSACKDEIDSIGLNLQDGDLINATRVEVPLTAYSMLDDSLITKNLLSNMVGVISDPVLGKTSAGFCTQFELAGNTVSFGNATLDSVVLTLQYYGFFGDTLSPLTFQVFQLGEALDHTTYYNCDSDPVTVGTNLCASSHSVYLRPTSSVVLDTMITTAHLRLRLSNAFGQSLMRDYSNTSDFQSNFHGLVVKALATNGVGCLGYFSLSSAMSGLTLYFHNENGAMKYTFPIGSNSDRYNFFVHDYSTGTPEMQLQVVGNDRTMGTQELYLQPTGGIKTHVSLSKLSDIFQDQKVIINKAELVLTNISEDDSYFFAPYNVALQVDNGDGTYSYVPDDAIFTNTDYFGGIYNENSKEYRFRITNYVQKLVKNGITDNGINILVSGAGVRANRLIFRGTDPTYDDHLRLDVYYTTY